VKILVVEDEIIIADNICSTLKNLNLEPTEPALNYTQAIARLMLEPKPDLALLDINLSGQKDGIDVAKFINENCPMPIVFLTAFGDDATIERAKNVKPCGYLLKPFTKANIKPTIEIAVSNFEARSIPNSEAKSYLERLSMTEMKVIQLIAERHTTPQIADLLFVTASTIKNHRHNICAKLELTPSNNTLLSWSIGHQEEIRKTLK
jgi:DNA-binding NarL/FixJ family response regulator